jgi:hypothetical protein
MTSHSRGAILRPGDASTSQPTLSLFIAVNGRLVHRMNLQGPPRVCRKSRQAQKGRIEDSFIALRKLINMEQRIGNLKLTLRLSPRYFKGTLPVTESVVLPPN